MVAKADRFAHYTQILQGVFSREKRRIKRGFKVWVKTLQLIFEILCLVFPQTFAFWEWFITEFIRMLRQLMQEESAGTIITLCDP